MSRSARFETAIFIAIIGVAAALRLPGLDRVPPELNQDEASRGVDAWQILKTGADRHGHHLPFFLESFGPGDWTAALTTYITVPFVAILGPTTVAMRLPDALLGTATVAIVYFWLRRGRGWRAAACAAAVLATNPWHIALCRTAHESGFAPFFLALALLALDRAGVVTTDDADANATAGRRALWAALAGFMLSMHTWCYPATRLFTPLLCAAILALYWKRIRAMVALRDGRRILACGAISLIAGASPIWLTALGHPERLAARAAVTLRMYGGGSMAEIVADIGRNWLLNVDPRYLFIEADEMSGAVIPGVGQQLPAIAPLLLAGLIACMIRCRGSAFAAFVIAWWLIYPIPAAVCHDWNPHPMRTVGGMLVYPVLAAIGFDWLFVTQEAVRRIRRRGALAVVELAALVNVVYFGRVYFTDFQVKAAPLYQTGLIQALRAAEDDGDSHMQYVVTNSTLQPYIYAMWLDALRAGSAVSTEIDAEPGPRGFHQVTGWGRYAFAPAHTDGFDEAVQSFQERLAGWTAEGTPLRAIVRESEAGVRPVLARFVHGDGSDAYQNFVICDLTATDLSRDVPATP